MKTPPAASVRLGSAWWYRWMVSLLASLLIAACAAFPWASGLFGSKNGLQTSALPAASFVAVALVALAATLAALWDAWRPRYGALHYADGHWVLAQGDVEYQGTLQPVFDLYVYILVRFTANSDGLNRHHPSDRLAKKQQQWLHLESRHAGRNPHRNSPDWLAVRRAAYCTAAPPYDSPYASPYVSPYADPEAAYKVSGTAHEPA
jgi:hypothetical protein